MGSHLAEVDELEARLEPARGERDRLAAAVATLEGARPSGPLDWAAYATVVAVFVAMAWAVTPRPAGPPIVEYLPAPPERSFADDAMHKCLAGDAAMCRALLTSFALPDHPIAVLLRQVMCDELHEREMCDVP